MTNEETRLKFLEWFKGKYPLEYYYFLKIESNLDKLYSSKYIGLHEGEFAEISLNMRKTDRNKYNLIADPFTALFIGSSFKTMMDEFYHSMESVIYDTVQKEIERRFNNKCPYCNILNLADSNFCNECGTSIESN